MIEIDNDQSIMDGWVEQSELMDCLLPRIRKIGKRYRKYKNVHARPAQRGETINSVTSDGHETRNTASEGDFVVENITSAKERYLVDAKVFNERYRLISRDDPPWGLYEPFGQLIGIEVNQELLDFLELKSPFLIEASWGEPQTVLERDMLVAPLPDCDEIYRIGRREFGETYKEINSQFE